MAWYRRLYRPGLTAALAGALAILLLAPSFQAAHADPPPGQVWANPPSTVACPPIGRCPPVALGRAATEAAAVYVPVFDSPSAKAALRERPSRFTVELTPVLGATYHVTAAQWQDWGKNRTSARVTGGVTCNQQGPCGSFRAVVTLMGIRTDSTCHARIYSHMQVGQITDATTGRLLRAGGPGYIATTWTCPTVVAPARPAMGAYVGMGDSYSSGQGADFPSAPGCSFPLYVDPSGNPVDTDNLTDINTALTCAPMSASPNDTCHRSLTAYSHLLARTLGLLGTFRFVACSGAVVHDAYVATGASDRQGESPQLTALGPNVGLVTLGFGGDDLHFADVVKGCVTPGKTAVDCLKPEVDELSLIGYHTKLRDPTSDGTPRSVIDAQNAGRTRDLVAQFEGRSGSSLSAGLLGEAAEYSNSLNVHDRLVLLLRVIRALAPSARILILGYPHWFPHGGATHDREHFKPFEQTWIDDRIRLVDETIHDATDESGVAQYVDVHNAFAGHELDNTTTTWPVDSQGNATCNGAGTYMNGVDFLAGTLDDSPELMHPNPCGHKQGFVPAVLRTYNQQPSPVGRFLLGAGQHAATTIRIARGTRRVTITAQWSQGQVTTLLTGPGAPGPGGARPTARGTLFATWTIEAPQPGTWKLRENNRAAAGANAISGTVTEGSYVAPTLPPGASVSIVSRKRGPVGCTATFQANVASRALGRVKFFSWYNDGGDRERDVSGSRHDRMTMSSALNSFHFILLINGTNGQDRYIPWNGRC